MHGSRKLQKKKKKRSNDRTPTKEGICRHGRYCTYPPIHRSIQPRRQTTVSRAELANFSGRASPGLRVPRHVISRCVLGLGLSLTLFPGWLSSSRMFGVCPGGNTTSKTVASGPLPGSEYPNPAWLQESNDKLNNSEQQTLRATWLPKSNNNLTRATAYVEGPPGCKKAITIDKGTHLSYNLTKKKQGELSRIRVRTSLGENRTVYKPIPITFHDRQNTTTATTTFLTHAWHLSRSRSTNQS